MKTVAAIWLIFWLLRLSAEDIRSYTIPNSCVLAVLAAAPFLSEASLGSRLCAAMLPFVLAGLMGMGDVKLYSALGAGFGLGGLMRVACASMLAGGAFAAVLLILGKARKRDRIAFGPFIAVSAVFYLLSSEAMWAMSLSMLQV